MSLVVFDVTKFRARYPEFTSISDEILQELFYEAILYCTNKDTSPIQDTETRRRVINMLVAHITALNFGVRGAAPNDLVGRISSATEGSVTVSADMGGGPAAGTKAWFLQTKYGAAYWQISLQFRGATWIGSDPLPILSIPPEG